MIALDVWQTQRVTVPEGSTRRAPLVFTVRPLTAREYIRYVALAEQSAQAAQSGAFGDACTAAADALALALVPEECPYPAQDIPDVLTWRELHDLLYRVLTASSLGEDDAKNSVTPSPTSTAAAANGASSVAPAPVADAMHAEDQAS